MVNQLYFEVYDTSSNQSASLSEPDLSREPVDPVPKLFLNGIGMTANHWKPLISDLNAGINLLHDFKDQLRSPKSPESYFMDSHAHELAELLNHRGIQQVDCIGTSYGSEVAMILALEYPHLVRSLVLIDGVSYSDPKLKAAVESWKHAALVDPRVFYRSLIPWNYSSDYIAHHKDELAQREEGVVGLPKEFFEGFARLCDSFLGFSITHRLSEITCPTLVLVGEEDILKTPEYSRVIHKSIKGSQFLMIPGAGHAVVIEQPKKLAQEITRFYRSTFSAS